MILPEAIALSVVSCKWKEGCSIVEVVTNLLFWEGRGLDEWREGGREGGEIARGRLGGWESLPGLYR